MEEVSFYTFLQNFYNFWLRFHISECPADGISRSGVQNKGKRWKTNLTKTRERLVFELKDKTTQPLKGVYNRNGYENFGWKDRINGPSLIGKMRLIGSQMQMEVRVKANTGRFRETDR